MVPGQLVLILVLSSKSLDPVNTPIATVVLGCKRIKKKASSSYKVLLLQMLDSWQGVSLDINWCSIRCPADSNDASYCWLILVSQYYYD
jgi:hypothetical protein